MQETEEQQYWRSIIETLQETLTLEQIALQMNVSTRQVSNWKSGDRPKGFHAIRLYLFREEHRTRVHGKANQEVVA